MRGNVKIRGKQEDVFNLLADNLQVWKTVIIREPKFDMREELDKEAIKIDREYGTIYVENTAYIKGTRRNFVEPDDIDVWKRSVMRMLEKRFLYTSKHELFHSVLQKEIG